MSKLGFNNVEAINEVNLENLSQELMQTSENYQCTYWLTFMEKNIDLMRLSQTKKLRFEEELRETHQRHCTCEVHYNNSQQKYEKEI